MSLTVGLFCFECEIKAQSITDDVECDKAFEDIMFFFDEGGSVDLKEMLEWIERHKNHGTNCIGFKTVG